MDQGSAQAVKEIENARERIGSNLHELEQRMPAPATLAKRAAGVALGGGATGTVFWMAVRRLRAKREEKKARERFVVNVLPEDVMQRFRQAMDEGRWQGWAAGFGAAWLLFRLAELRQLRSMRRAMTAR